MASNSACFFTDIGLHGACRYCASMELVLVPLGKMRRRLVCEACWKRHRDLIYETAVLAEDGWLGYNPLTPLGVPIPVKKS